LGPTFLARDVSAELWLGEFGILNEASILDQVMADPSAAAFISGVSLSWDTWSLVPALQGEYALPVMQTRHEPGNSPWLTGFAQDDAPNDFAYGVQTWELLYKWIDGGVNSYLAWNMVLDEHDEGLNEVQVWPKNTLLRVDPETNTLVETPAYYVFRHLSYFVDPGAVRLGVVSANGGVLAFENPDGSIAVALHNRDVSPTTITVSVAGRKPRFEVPGHGWATLLIQQ
jgi:glucosylceramidase